jgi:hypothetical protein
MKTLYLHTDTTDVINFRLPSTDPSQPHMVRLSLMLFEPTALPKPSVHIVTPADDWFFSPGAVTAHGITRAFATHSGADLRSAVAEFDALARYADQIVAYGSHWHRRVIERAYDEAKWAFDMPPREKWFCAMEAASARWGQERQMPGGGKKTMKMAQAYAVASGLDYILPIDPIMAGTYMVLAVSAIHLALEAQP